jgi:hypothetical protein
MIWPTFLLTILNKRESKNRKLTSKLADLSSIGRDKKEMVLCQENSTNLLFKTHSQWVTK